jgi:hypothetical protein
VPWLSRRLGIDAWQRPHLLEQLQVFGTAALVNKVVCVCGRRHVPRA